MEFTPIHSEFYRKLAERLKAPLQLRLRWGFRCCWLFERSLAGLGVSEMIATLFATKEGERDEWKVRVIG